MFNGSETNSLPAHIIQRAIPQRQVTCCGLNMIFDSTLLWKFQPSQTSFSGITEDDPLPEQPQPKRYTINAQGFRGEALDKGPKILFLGCSHTFGMGVHDWETAPYLTQKRMGIQCINAGVPGWGPFQCARLWPSLVNRYEIVAIIWQKPSVYRYPWHEDYAKSTWYHKEFEFNEMWKHDGLKYRKLLAQSIQAEIDWFEEIGLFCRERGISIYAHYYEVVDLPAEVESIRLAVEYGYVKTYRHELRRILSCVNFTDMDGEYPQTDYFVSPLDWHPNLLYNSILADITSAHLRRDLYGKRK